MRLAWLTDIHLNFVGTAARRALMEKVERVCDAVVISGDIAESHDVEGYLTEMEEIVQKPIYFVLGNHDFYRGSVAETRERVGWLAERSDRLVYLTREGVVEVTPNTALVGHDGWADGRLGNFERSEIVLNDFLLVDELARHYHLGLLDKRGLRRALEDLAETAAGHFARVLPEAASRYGEVIAVIHAPPFREAAWHEGQTSDDDWLPHMSCKVVGDVMLDVMRSHPNCSLLVLCGHTHGRGEVSVLENLRVLTGGAEYGRPEIQKVLDVG